MSKKKELSTKHSYEIKKISRIAQVIDDYTSESKKKNLIWATTEADITEARKKLKKHKEETGEAISFTGFLIACYSRVVEKHKNPINAMRKRKNKIYVFDEVDVMTNIEKTINGVKKPVNYTVRNANKKTLRQINDEIRAVQHSKKVEMSSGTKKGKKLLKIFPKLPRFIRKIIIHKIFSDPIRKKQMLGTVGLTAVGMFGIGMGHMIHLTPHTISFGVGGIDTHPFTIDGEIVSREWLGITLAMDHAIIDGGPAARFFHDLRYMITDNCHSADWCFKSI